MSKGEAHPSAARTVATVVGMSWMEAVLHTTSIHMASEAVPGLRRPIFLAASMPSGVAAFPSPSRLADTLAAMLSMISRSRAVWGKISPSTGRSSRDSFSARPERRMISITPVQRHIIPAREIHSSIAPWAPSTAAAATAATTAMPVVGNLSINTDSRQVFRDGKPMDLTTREYELLTFLASHPNKVYSRIDLMEQVWNYGYVGDDQRTVDVTVRRLREKIEETPASPKYILTRRGVGYYFAV